MVLTSGGGWHGPPHLVSAGAPGEPTLFSGEGHVVDSAEDGRPHVRPAGGRPEYLAILCVKSLQTKATYHGGKLTRVEAMAHCINLHEAVRLLGMPGNDSRGDPDGPQKAATYWVGSALAEQDCLRNAYAPPQHPCAICGKTDVTYSSGECSECRTVLSRKDPLWLRVVRWVTSA